LWGGLAFTSDGEILASASDDKTVRLWSVKDGKFQTLTGHKGHVSSIAFSPDNRHLASGSSDWTIRVWNVSTRAPEKVIRVNEKEEPGNFKDNLQVAFSPDGKRLAGGNDSTLRVWDTTSWEQTFFQATPAGFVAFAPDSKTLLSAGIDWSVCNPQQLKRWDVDKGELLAAFPLRGARLTTWYHLSADGKTLAVCADNDSVVQFYDAQTGQPRYPDPGHTRQVHFVAFSPDNKLLASGGYDAVIRLWDLATAKELRKFEGHTNDIKELAFTPDGKTLASASWDATVRLWDVASAKLLWTFAANPDGIERMAMSPDGKILASCGSAKDPKIRLWNIADRTLLRVIDQFKTTVGNVVFSPDGKWLGAMARDGTVGVWDAVTGAPLRRKEKVSLAGDGMAFLSDGDSLILSGPSCSWQVYSVLNDVMRPPVRAHVPWYVKIDVRKDGRLFATGGPSGTFQLWDPSTQPPQRQTYRLFPYNTWVDAAVFSPDGRFVATANPDGTIYLFRFAKADQTPLAGLSNPDVAIQAAKQFIGHKSQRMKVAFSHDGKRAFSASRDGSARIWNVATGTELLSLPHPKGVIELAVSPDDSQLITTCEDLILRVWDVASGKETRRFEGEHGRWELSLSPDGTRLMASANDSQGQKTVILDFKTGIEMQRLPYLAFGTWTPDGRRLFISEVNQLRLVNAAEDVAIFPFFGHRNWIRSTAVSPDGLLGLTCAGGPFEPVSGNFESDFSARLWDLRTGQQLHCWQETSFTRHDVAFTPGGRRALASSLDGTIRVYDISTGKELACLEAPAPVWGVAVSPDGRAVLGGCHDGVMRLWELPEGVADPPAGKGK
jgi:eukaryotic-like serine/threonine-protein kinase